MALSLTNACATFQRFMNKVLKEALNIFVCGYLDDMIIFSENKEEHIKHVLWAQTNDNDPKWISDFILEYGDKQPHVETNNQTND
ncbi:unnamed protein product [Brachionus calyciflorus]|uniref:Reverse transcriptase domain-containing protein n=1 Tax=Brachionus calyciflorus TaxID=104777 RepID=A0A814NDP9_9BILA|nr:unnamed protein product [Brachionus calyciflorus]